MFFSEIEKSLINYLQVIWFAIQCLLWFHENTFFPKQMFSKSWNIFHSKFNFDTLVFIALHWPVYSRWYKSCTSKEHLYQLRQASSPVNGTLTSSDKEQNVTVIDIATHSDLMCHMQSQNYFVKLQHSFSVAELNFLPSFLNNYNIYSNYQPVVTDHVSKFDAESFIL